MRQWSQHRLGTRIIEKKLGTDPQTIAQDLLDGLPGSDRAAWVAVPIAGLANESFQVTRRKSVQHCVRVGAKCIYQQRNETFSEGESEKVVIVDTASGTACSIRSGSVQARGHPAGEPIEHDIGSMTMPDL